MGDELTLSGERMLLILKRFNNKLVNHLYRIFEQFLLVAQKGSALVTEQVYRIYAGIMRLFET